MLLRFRWYRWPQCQPENELQRFSQFLVPLGSRDLTAPETRPRGGDDGAGNSGVRQHPPARVHSSRFQDSAMASRERPLVSGSSVTPKIRDSTQMPA